MSNVNRYASDVERCKNTAILQINFVKANKNLCKETYYQAIEQMEEQLKTEHYLTPIQMSFIDGIYESVMKNAGLPSVPVHVDRKRKRLKYGA